MSSKPLESEPANKPHLQDGENHSVEYAETGFFRQLLYRRVPQAMGFYLAGSWTFLEFFESLISRYNISPHWQDISLLVIVLLFPSMLILSYRHGAPGIQKWTAVEKLGIPINFFITFLIIYSQFSDKDLGKSAEMIKGVGPDGSIVELERPKAAFRKRLAISFFNINDSNADKSLALGLPIAIKQDLEQDPYINIYHPGDLSYPIRQSNDNKLKIPMALMLKIANNIRIEYLLIGSLSKENDNFVLNSRLYRVADGKLIKKLEPTKNSDIFTAVDDLTTQVRLAMGFSQEHISQSVDLPISEQLTSSEPAFLAYVKSQIEEKFENNFVISETELKTAIKLDNSFAVAASQYAFLLIGQTRIEEGLAQLQIAKKHNYRLSDSNKFALGAVEALLNANPELARTIVKQWLKLFPDNADAWTMKFTLHRNFNERLLAIEALRQILRIEPFGTHRHLLIGQIYTSLGDTESALKEYTIFTSKNPSNAQGHLLTGDSYRVLGKLQSAKEEYQQAKLLLSNDITADQRIADLNIRHGNFLAAEQDMYNNLESSTTAEEKANIWIALANYYWLRGQRIESLNALRNSFAIIKTIQPETTYLLRRIRDSWRFAESGLPEEGQRMIDDANILLTTSKSDIYTSNLKISRAMFDAVTGKTDNAIRLINEADQSMKSYIGSGISDNISMFTGFAQYMQGDYENAASNLNLFLQHNPNNQIFVKTLLGEALFNNGKTISAKTTFEQILIEHPFHPRANFGMAKIEVELEKPEKAKSFLEKALKGWELADNSFEPANEARKLNQQLKSI